MIEHRKLELAELSKDTIQKDLDYDRRSLHIVVSSSGIEYQILITLHPNYLYGMYINRTDNELLRCFQHYTSIEKCIEYMYRVCL